MAAGSHYILVLALLMGACTARKPVDDPSQILKDANSFWAYKQKYIRLYENFQAVDNQLNPITRETFLRVLATGRYLPLRLQTQDTTTLYQLYPIPERVDKNLQALLRQWAYTEYDNYLAEGKSLPDYHFVDLEGKVYSKQTTKGKVLVLKCWFVHCVACVAEMPALNELKKRYRHRNDILFVSLCLDSADKVAAFLRKTKFDYATVADQTDYLEEQLKIGSYPMHLVINKEGLVIKKVNNYHGVVYTLQKIL
jgi:thiol-disulfide isomerase/thioredoxin